MALLSNLLTLGNGSFLSTSAAASTYLSIANAASTYAPLASPSFTGNVKVNTTLPLWDTYNIVGFPGGGALGGVSGVQRLDVVQNTFYQGGQFYYTATAAASIYRQQSGAHTWFNAASGTAGQATTFSQAMTLDASGNLLVALTGQVGAGTICTVNSATKNGVVVKDSASGSYLYSGLNSSNSSVFLVLGSGNVQNANNSYGAISDVKLKENIVDASPKLADLMQVRVRNYNLIGETTRQLGVVAQELETVFPGMVDETLDRDAEGNALGTTTKSVKYSVFVPMLIKAIQELKAEIDVLKGQPAV